MGVNMRERYKNVFSKQIANKSTKNNLHKI